MTHGMLCLGVRSVGTESVCSAGIRGNGPCMLIVSCRLMTLVASVSLVIFFFFSFGHDMWDHSSLTRD